MSNRATTIPDKFHFITVVWGEKHIALFVDYVLPCLLSSGNIPAWPWLEKSVYCIYTLDHDVARIKSSQAFIALSKLMDVNVVAVDKTEVYEQSNKYLSLMVFHKVALDGASKENAAMLLLAPDLTISDEGLKNISEIVRKGKRLITFSAYRANKNGTSNEIDASFPLEHNGARTIPARDMAGIGIRNFHQFSNSLYITSSETASLCHIYWKVPGEGIVVHGLHPYPIYINPEKKNVAFTALDIDYTFKSCPRLEDTFNVTDSDVINGFGMDDDNEVYPLHRRETPYETAKWFLLNNSEHHRHFFEDSYRIHYTEVTSRKWSDVESECKRYVRKIKFNIALVKALMALNWYFLSTKMLLHKYNIIKAKDIVGSDYLLRFCMKKILKKLPFGKGVKVALYGAGLHTQRLVNLDLIPLDKFCAVFDDSPSKSEHCGLRVYASGNAGNVDFDVLIISSDQYEQQMFEKAKEWMPKGKLMATIYTSKFYKS